PPLARSRPFSRPTPYHYCSLFAPEKIVMSLMVPAFFSSIAVPLLKDVGSRAADLFRRDAKRAVLTNPDVNLGRNAISLLNVTKQTRVEPITMIDQRLANDTELGQVL